MFVFSYSNVYILVFIAKYMPDQNYISHVMVPVDNFGTVVGENPTPYGILVLWVVNGLSIVYWGGMWLGRLKGLSWLNMWIQDLIVFHVSRRLNILNPNFSLDTIEFSHEDREILKRDVYN